MSPALNVISLGYCLRHDGTLYRTLDVLTPSGRHPSHRRRDGEDVLAVAPPPPEAVLLQVARVSQQVQGDVSRDGLTSPDEVAPHRQVLGTEGRGEVGGGRKITGEGKVL